MSPRSAAQAGQQATRASYGPPADECRSPAWPEGAAPMSRGCPPTVTTGSQDLGAEEPQHPPARWHMPEGAERRAGEVVTVHNRPVLVRVWWRRTVRRPFGARTRHSFGM